jgi:osmotically-inducible protein OsmY
MKPRLPKKRKVPDSAEPPRDNTAASVLEAIDCITTVPREALTITVHEGWVRLEGTLPDWSQKEIVDNVVRHVAGVKGLISLIHVQQPSLPKPIHI